MEWISVEDELPKNSRFVLATDGHHSWLYYAFVFETGEVQWFNAAADSEKKGITHWMPLPEPPKEE